jgi:hypothetical protein
MRSVLAKGFLPACDLSVEITDHGGDSYRCSLSFSSIHHSRQLSSLLSELGLATNDVSVFVEHKQAGDEDQGKKPGDT